jgi:hypothetical protein
LICTIFDLLLILLYERSLALVPWRTLFLELCSDLLGSLDRGGGVSILRFVVAYLLIAVVAILVTIA